MALALSDLKPHKTLIGPSLNETACPNCTLFKHGIKGTVMSSLGSPLSLF